MVIETCYVPGTGAVSVACRSSEYTYLHHVELDRKNRQGCGVGRNHIVHLALKTKVLLLENDYRYAIKTDSDRNKPMNKS